MTFYAEKTQVPISRSRVQIETELTRYGIQEYGIGHSPRGTGIIFKYDGKVYKMNVNEPDGDEFDTQRKLEQAKRSRWRLLLLCVKAKLNLIQSGQSSFEDEFLAYMALPDGSTVSDFMQQPENIERLQKSKMPKMLVGASI